MGQRQLWLKCAGESKANMAAWTAVLCQHMVMVLGASLRPHPHFKRKTPPPKGFAHAFSSVRLAAAGPRRQLVAYRECNEHNDNPLQLAHVLIVLVVPQHLQHLLQHIIPDTQQQQ